MSLLSRWRILPLLMAFVALAHFNRISMSVAGAEQIIPSGLIPDTEMGLVYSAYLLPYALLMIAGGWLIDRRGPRFAWIVMGFGSAVFVAATGVVGLLGLEGVALWWGLLLVRACLGAVSAPLHPTAATLVGRWIPPSAATLANGMVNCAALLGIAATYVTFGLLMDRLGWPGAFLACAAVTLGLALLWTVLGGDSPPEYRLSVSREPGIRLPPPDTSGAEDGIMQGRSLPQSVPIFVPVGRRLLRIPSLWFLTASYALVGYFQYLFFYWAQYYFETIQGLPQVTGRRYATLLSLAMGAGMVAGGWLSDRAALRLGPRRGLALIPIVGLLVSTLTVFLGLAAPTPQATLACFLAAMAGAGMSEGSYWTASVRLGGSRAGAASALMNTGGNIGGLIAPALTPIISAVLGWKAGLGAAGIVCLAGAVLWLVIDPEEQPA